MIKKIKFAPVAALILAIMLTMSACTGGLIPTVTKSSESASSTVTAAPSNTKATTVVKNKDNVRMIISKNSGKALSEQNNKGLMVTYDFLTEQTWLVEATDNIVKFKNMLTSKYLEDKNNTVLTSDASNADTQKWQITTDDAGFSTLKNVSTGKMLMVDESNNLILSDASNSKRDLWRLMDVYLKDVPHSDASWLMGGFGVMTHLLPDFATRKSIAEKHDAQAIAEQLHEVGASYYILSVGQMTGCWNTPNKVYSSMVSYSPNNRYPSEDIITEMAKALKKYNIKLIVYCVPISATAVDNKKYSDPKDFNFYTIGNNTRYLMNMENAMLWSMVLQEWSDTYGDLVSGWWVDGCYPACLFNSNIASLYANALKHGNPNAIVSFNKGIFLGPYVTNEDFTTGETDNPMGLDQTQVNNKENWMLPKEGYSPKFSTGTQWFELTYIGKWWLDPQMRYTPELWADYVYEVINKKGAIALDVAHDKDNGYRFTDDAMKVLKAVGTKLGKIK